MTEAYVGTQRGKQIPGGFEAHADTFFRWLFYGVFLCGGAIFWLAKFPPMADLPQHAGQIMLLHDLLLHHSLWQNEVRINYFTPYWIGYGAATMLSFVVPVLTAVKLELTLAYYGFVASLIFMRRRLGGDARLDWLFLVGWFGYAYEYGFFTFLVSAPFAILFIEWARTYAVRPDRRRASILLFAGVVLFFCHGLIFLFANAIGVTFVLLRYRRNVLAACRALWPYALLSCLCAVYFLLHREIDLRPMYPVGVLWREGWIRLLGLCMWPWGIVPHPLLALGFTYLLFLAPCVMGITWNPHFGVKVPFAIALLTLLLVPHFAMNTFFLYQRFGLFFFPFYAMMFSRADHIEKNTWRRIGEYLGSGALAATCAAFFLIQAKDAYDFKHESRDFESIMALAETGQRTLGLVWNKFSPAADNPVVYENFVAWYQAEKHGLVDFNFAWFPPQVVRFRSNSLPEMSPLQFKTFEEDRKFDWGKFQADRYRYFFIKGPDSYFAGAINNIRCSVKLLGRKGEWSVYENFGCK